jgi:hypothetical protein
MRFTLQRYSQMMAASFLFVGVMGPGADLMMDNDDDPQPLKSAPVGERLRLVLTTSSCGSWCCSSALSIPISSFLPITLSNVDRAGIMLSGLAARAGEEGTGQSLFRSQSTSARRGRRGATVQDDHAHAPVSRQ